MKRVYNLYRVSGKKQVSEKDDIPMQQIACKNFAKQMNWVVTKEFFEKGISGYKVSANDRDAIQDLKEAAEKKEFDILLVYMFDRLGRRDEETPFIDEWFVKQGIEVWSTQEGQQKFENQTDKLMNYIRFWQASGESVKTSIRVSTRFAQLTEEGKRTGGVTPFGYKLVKNGTYNKKGYERSDLVVDEKEANIVRMIFEKTVYEGYGSYRLSTYINQLGVKTHNGSAFQSNTVNRILRNRIYCGYIVRKDIVSPKQENIVIISEGLFESAQTILNQRNMKIEQKKHMALCTKGNTLLGGNIYCAHCGSKMGPSLYTYNYKRADGTVRTDRKYRYICYQRSRDKDSCDGSTTYMAERIEPVICQLAMEFLDKIKSIPKKTALKKRYDKQIESCKRLKSELVKDKEKNTKQLDVLKGEIPNALVGESAFSIQDLSSSIEILKEKISKIEEDIEHCERTLQERNNALKAIDYNYEECLSWAEIFKDAPHDKKKMILSHIFSEIRIGKGYEIEVVYNMTYQQFLEIR